MDNHSPLPWRIWRDEIVATDAHDFDDEVIGTIGVSSGFRSHTFTLAKSKTVIASNAELIVAAVNSYHKHLEDIAKLRKALEQQADAWANAVELKLIQSQHETTAIVLRDNARAALRETDQ